MIKYGKIQFNRPPFFNELLWLCGLGRQLVDGAMGQYNDVPSIFDCV